MKTTVRHGDWLMERLKSADFAAEYLNAASEDDDPRSYLIALRNVVDARGGIAAVAQKTSLSKETLYRTLSARGNPTIKTLTAVLNATGLKIAVSAH
jgi:probable addiction module antidote protein